MAIVRILFQDGSETRVTCDSFPQARRLNTFLVENIDSRPEQYDGSFVSQVTDDNYRPQFASYGFSHWQEWSEFANNEYKTMSRIRDSFRSHFAGVDYSEIGRMKVAIVKAVRGQYRRTYPEFSLTDYLSAMRSVVAEIDRQRDNYLADFRFQPEYEVD